MLTPVFVHWFRQDLRLNDNPSFTHACSKGHVLPIYILDDDNASSSAMGEASRWWLHKGLSDLANTLNGALSFYKGDAAEVLADIIKRLPIKGVYWNRCYEPWRIKRDSRIKEYLTSEGIEVDSFNGSLLWEPWTVTKKDGTPYKVFTPFYRKGCLESVPPRAPCSAPCLSSIIRDTKGSLSLDNLKLLPQNAWYMHMDKYWQVGEKAAADMCHTFISQGLDNYKDGRNFPAKPCVSRLSPYLHFGHISPHQVWHNIRSVDYSQNSDHFCSELGWREFSYNLLYYNPELPSKSLQKKFDEFPWNHNDDLLKSWQKGKTGIPIVDAGMRELWQTGYMHNRVRMIVGSFLVKNLLISWRHGAQWFWDTLVDADLANNSAGWQWIAGCGADASPYFRVFNPVIQGQKFDPEGVYVRKFVTELSDMPTKFIFNPWEAPQSVLNKANIVLGKTYPYPLVDLKLSREKALAAFSSLRST